MQEERQPLDRAVEVVPVVRVGVSGVAGVNDALAIEEPLEIRLGHDHEGVRQTRTVSITMRTPGDDADLALGFLFTEGLLTTPAELAHVHACGRSGNVVRVELQPNSPRDLARQERHSFLSSSCGVCGKTSLEAVRAVLGPRLTAEGPRIEAAVLHELPATLRASQPTFERTGGLHAASLFDAAGTLLCVREDVGRHNALDKLIGHFFRAGRMPLSEAIVLVSGRLSFELVQKAAVAGIPILAAVGAPSSLAVELALECNMTLAGFVRSDRLNLYTGAERVRFQEMHGSHNARTPLILDADEEAHRCSACP